MNENTERGHSTNDNVTEKSARTRTPRTYADIERGAINMELGDRVKLVKVLKSSIDEEVEQKEQAAKEAKELANGS